MSLKVARPKYTLLISILVLLSLGLMITTISYQSAKKIPSWSSFSQIPKSSNYRLIGNILDNSKDEIAIAAPTAEEAVWISGLRRNLDLKTIALGPERPALLEALTHDCLEREPQVFGVKSDSLVLIGSETRDITPSLGNNLSLFGKHFGWQKISFAELGNSLVVLGSGLFPPEFDAHGKVFRWSSGSSCFGAFSTEQTRLSVSLFFEPGPEAQPDNTWNIQNDSQKKKITLGRGAQTLTFELLLKKGWNLIQISKNGCRHAPTGNSRWNVRADDRLLCYRLFQMKATWG